MPDYSVVIRSTHGNTIYSEIAAFDLSYGFALNGYGSFSFKVAMADPHDAFTLTTPNKYSVCIERNGVLVYSGIIWQRQLDYTNRVITVSGNEWGSIYERHLMGDYFYDGMTVGAVLDVLLNSAGAADSLVLPTPIRLGGGLGLTHTITGAFEESAQITVYAAINQLAQSMTDGFEFRWKSTYVSGALDRYCVVGDALGTLTPAVVDHYAPGGGGTVHTLVVDERDAPNSSNIYTYDGYLIGKAFISNTTADNMPVFSEVGYSFPTDYTDDQAFDIGSGRISLFAHEGATDPSTKVYTLGFFNPSAVTAFGVEGDTLLLDLEGREGVTPTRRTIKITGRDVSVGTEGETLTITATTKTAPLADVPPFTTVQRTFG